MNPQFVNSQSKLQSDINGLIESCRRGDQKAQLQIYKLYYKPVYNLCLQIINERNMAEELMQESFLLAFDNINSYTGKVEFFSWIINHILYAYRDEKNSR